MWLRSTITIFCFVLFEYGVQSQTTHHSPSSTHLIILDSNRTCGWNRLFKQNQLWEFEVNESDSMLLYVYEICKREVIDPNSFIIKRGNVENAVATLDANNRRVIYYSEDFFRSLDNKWYRIQILAHEIAHHINNHILGSNNSRMEDELYADRFSGKVLCEFGAPYEYAKKLILDNCPAIGSSSYPPSAARLEAVLSGYNDAGCSFGNPRSPFNNIITTPTENTLTFDSLIDKEISVPIDISGFKFYKTLNNDSRPGVFNATGSLFLSASTYTSCRDSHITAVLRTATGKVEKTFSGGYACHTLSNTDKLLVAADELEGNVTHVYIYDYASTDEIYNFIVNDGDIYAMKFSPNDKYLVVCAKSIHIFDLKSRNEIVASVPKHSSNFSIDFSSDSRLFALKGFNNEIYIYSIEKTQVIKILKREGNVSAMAFIPGTEKIVYTIYTKDKAESNFLRIVNTNNDSVTAKFEFFKNDDEIPRSLQSFRDLPKNLNALTVSKDGRYIAVSGKKVGGIVKIFTSEGVLIQKFTPDKGDIQSLFINNNNRFLITSSVNSYNTLYSFEVNTVQVWRSK